MIYLSLGSNKGNREDNLASAIKCLEERLGVNIRFSSVIETSPVGFESDQKFLNQVVAFSRPEGLEPEKLLDICQQIEIGLGRPAHKAEYNEDGTRLYTSRTIDIDILFFDDITVNTQRLVIPHPSVSERMFVTLPLMELL